MSKITVETQGQEVQGYTTDDGRALVLKLDRETAGFVAVMIYTYPGQPALVTLLRNWSPDRPSNPARLVVGDTATITL